MTRVQTRAAANGQDSVQAGEDEHAPRARNASADLARPPEGACLRGIVPGKRVLG